MANQEQLKILRQGFKVWNEWREKYRDVQIDLSGVDFRNIDLDNGQWGADLSNANLANTIFGYVQLYFVNFSGANLSNANFEGAHLSLVDFSDANLHNANLIEAYLKGTNLNGANLDEADLRQSIFRFSNVKGVCLSNARFGGTFVESVDLSEAIDIETIKHDSGSYIDIDTLRHFGGEVPELFIRGCGLSDWEIESAKLYGLDLSNDEVNKIIYRIYDLRATQPIQISPLFISYSHLDAPFVDTIVTHLDAKGIRFWRDTHDATAGRLEKQIDRAIHQNPTVLLVLSEHSTQSDWVEHEVRIARELEKELKRDVLCPVALDISWKTSPWPKRLMEQIMEYNILDFSAWRDETQFKQNFMKLIDGLQLFYKG